MRVVINGLVIEDDDFWYHRKTQSTFSLILFALNADELLLFVIVV